VLLALWQLHFALVSQNQSQTIYKPMTWFVPIKFIHWYRHLHLIFMCHKNSTFLLIFFQLMKHKNTILSSWLYKACSELGLACVTLVCGSLGQTVKGSVIIA
jgi:hypothetical protein